MKKRIAASLVSLVLALSMASCGKVSSVDTTPKDLVQASETVVTTTTEATATEETTTEKSDSDSKTETTKKKKKKKKKATDTKNTDSKTKSKKTDSKKSEKKTETKKTETAKAEETTAVKEETPADKDLKHYSNSVFSVDFSEENWVSLEDYKKLITKLASKQNKLLSQSDYEKIIGAMYFYKDDTSSSYPTNMVISEPMYQAELSGYSIDDIGEQLAKSMEQQVSSNGNIKIRSHDFVTHNGTKMLRITAHGEQMGISYDCDEYIFIRDGYMCMLVVNYTGETAGKAEFEKMLDTIKIFK